MAGVSGQSGSNRSRVPSRLNNSINYWNFDLKFCAMIAELLKSFQSFFQIFSNITWGWIRWFKSSAKMALSAPLRQRQSIRQIRPIDEEMQFPSNFSLNFEAWIVRWKRMEANGSGWKRMEGSGSGRKRVEAGGSGWKRKWPMIIDEIVTLRSIRENAALPVWPRIGGGCD